MLSRNRSIRNSPNWTCFISGIRHSKNELGTEAEYLPKKAFVIASRDATSINTRKLRREMSYKVILL